jgi:hypothetical protein
MATSLQRSCTQLESGLSLPDQDDRHVLAAAIRGGAGHHLTPRDLASLLGRAGVPGFADEILRRMASPLHET